MRIGPLDQDTPEHERNMDQASAEAMLPQVSSTNGHLPSPAQKGHSAKQSTIAAIQRQFSAPGNDIPKQACKWLTHNVLLALTIGGVVAGTALGFALRGVQLSADAIVLISLPGELLMRMLKLLILPLIVSSIITGLSRLDAKSTGRMGSITMIYYMLTTLLATIVGISCVLAIHPGNPANNLISSNGSQHDGDQNQVSSLDAFLDLTRNLFPDNLVRACLQQTHTVYVTKNVTTRTLLLPDDIYNSAVTTSPDGVTTVDDALLNRTWQVQMEEVTTRTLENRDGMNVLGLIIFCTVFGIIISQMGEEADVMQRFFHILSEMMIRIIGLVMWFAPIGIMSLIAGKVASIDDLIGTAEKLGLYIVTVIVGLLIHCSISLPAIYLIATRQNPLTFFRGMLQAWFTALATASSAATLPITIRCVENNNGIDPRVARFVLPLGATVNMDGSALYEAVTAIFIAQLNGIELGPGQVITVSVVATLASIGNASMPHAALVTIIIVLSAVGLPAEDVGLVFAVDWLLDRVRTAVNVQGDAFGAGILQHLVKDTLEKSDLEALPSTEHPMETTIVNGDVQEDIKSSVASV